MYLVLLRHSNDLCSLIWIWNSKLLVIMTIPFLQIYIYICACMRPHPRQHFLVFLSSYTSAMQGCMITQWQESIQTILLKEEMILLKKNLLNGFRKYLVAFLNRNLAILMQLRQPSWSNPSVYTLNIVCKRGNNLLACISGLGQTQSTTRPDPLCRLLFCHFWSI